MGKSQKLYLAGLGMFYVLASFHVSVALCADELTTTGQPSPAPLSPVVPGLAPSRSLSSEEIRAHAQSKVFRLVTQFKDGKGKQFYGNAFVIDVRGLLVTNYHIVSTALAHPAKTQLVLKVGNAVLPAQIISFSAPDDIALISVQYTFDGAYRLASKPPRPSERVYVLGMSQGPEMSIVEGSFSEIERRGAISRLIFSAPFSPGLEGGPVVNSSEELLGINDTVFKQPKEFAFATPAPTLESFLQSHQVPLLRYDPKKKGQVIAQVKDYLLPWLRDWESQGRNNPPRTLGGFKIFSPPSNLKCIDNTSTEEPVRVRSEGIQLLSCSNQHGFSVSPRAEAGVFKLSYFHQPKSNGGSSFFASQLKKKEADSFVKGHREGARYVCHHRFVVTRNNLRVLAEYCLTGLTSLPGLYDLVLTVAPVGSHSSFFSVMNLQGFEMESIELAAALFLETVEGPPQ